MALDERLRRELERAGRPADPTGVYEDLIRRHERRRVARRIQVVGLTALVVLGSVGGFLVLSRVFGGADGRDLVGMSAASGRIAYVEYDEETGVTGFISVMDPDGTHAERLFETPGRVTGFDWSSDGMRVAFVAESDVGRPWVYVAAADGSDRRRVARAAGNATVSWSPDGTQLAYPADWNGTVALFSVDASGGDPRRLTGADQYVATPDWSPDGRSIAYASEEPNLMPEFIDIYVVDVDTGAVRRLTDDPALDFEPRWSPDGTRILFRSRRDEVPAIPLASDSPDEIYVMNADGSSQTRLTFDSSTDQFAVWSPDGSQIAYRAEAPGAPAGIVVMNSDGSDPRPIPVAGVVLAWQPPRQDPTISISPAVTPPPSLSPSIAAGEDIGLGFPVCNVSSIEANFVESGVPGIAYVATRVGDTGRCPAPEDAFDVVAIDGDADGAVDTSYGPIACTLECRTFSTPDLDGDGTAELLVVQDGGAVLGLGLYDVRVEGGAVSLEPVVVAPPGDPEGGFEPGVEAKLWLGGDAFELYTLRCGDPEMRHGPGLVVTTAESLPHDSPDALWHAHRVVFALVDGSLRLMDVGDFTEPAGFEAPSFQSDTTLCGSSLGP